ncbi:MAG: delta-60 repeat domain-containing protein [Flavobacteriales bacterium]|nr:delta-60 repeat domain-containing protein [Flavobacteriales bacterium]
MSGWFTTVNGTPRNKIARLNVDGTLDSSFDPGTGAGHASDLHRCSTGQQDLDRWVLHHLQRHHKE